jgi:hypothetical protein
MKKFLSLLFVLLASSLFSQNLGDFRGKVIDGATGLPLEYAAVQLDVNGQIRSQLTDSIGNYDFRGVPAGKYILRLSFIGYSTMEIGIEVVAEITTLIQELTFDPSLTMKIVVISPRERVELTSPVTKINSEELIRSPLKNNLPELIAVSTPGVSMGPNRELYFKGSRRNSTGYYVDGVKMTALPVIPSGSISGMQIFTSGIPAKFGDITGGVVVVQSKTYFEIFNERNNQ